MKKISVLMAGFLMAILLAACAADQPTLPVTTPELTSAPITTPELTSAPITTPEPTSAPVTTPEPTSSPITTPTSSETEPSRWNQAMSNPNTYELTGNMSVEEAANQLVVMFLDALKEPDETRTFRLTAWKDLTIEIYPSSDALTQEVDWGVRENSRYITDHTWLVYVEAFIQYEGTYTPVGPWIYPSDTWYIPLYQGSRRPLILTRTDTGYTLFAWQPELENN